MKRKFLPLTILMLTLSVTLVHAQVVTPGMGQSFTFQDFTTLSPATVTSPSAGHYTLLQDITISAGDTLLLDANTREILCYNPITLTVHGCVLCAPRTDTLLITCNTSNCGSEFYEIRLDSAANSHFSDILFEYGNDIQVMQSEVKFERCVFRYFKEQCIKYSNASPVIEYCNFYENRKAVIFRLTYVPASYEVKREGNALSVVFRGAEGTMDGLPYASGEPVTGRGYHRFVMTDEFGEETETMLSFPEALVMLLPNGIITS